MDKAKAERENAACNFQPDPAGGFFCHCGQGSKALPAPPTCWKCWQANPVARFGGRAKRQPAEAACRFRGELVRMTEGKLCAARSPQEVFACNCDAIAQTECAASVRGRDNRHTVAVCLGCDFFEAPKPMAIATTQPSTVNEETPVAELMAAIEAVDEIPDDWKPWTNTHAAFLGLLDLAAEESHAAAYAGEGRGIVIGAGGATFFACAFNCVLELRRLGCELPVELWHLGEGEFDSQMQRAAEALPGDVRVVDASVVAEREKPRRLNGWELKPFSVCHSAFAEVLYLDADIVPAVDPTYIFDAPQYLDVGSVFWPDLAPSARKEWLPYQCWENCGLDYHDEVDFESGQFVVDKRRVSPELFVTLHMNEHSDWYYGFVFGDKSTYHLAWRKLGTPYAMPGKACGWRRPCILQYDFRGELFTQHACQGKAELVAGDALQCLTDPRSPVRSADKRREVWNGRIYDYQSQTERERLAAVAIEGVYNYAREGNGERVLRLASQGAITEGGAACEKRWSVQIENGEAVLTIVGEAHKNQEVGMMRLRLSEGVWRGRWLWHNRERVTLRPIGPADLSRPHWWTSRAGTWDDQIFENVAVENEYRLPARLRPDAVVLDIGAHVGAFSFAVLRRGAAMVHAYEANPENFRIAQQNLALSCLPAEVHHAAVWQPGFDSLAFNPSGDSTNTGGGGCAIRGKPDGLLRVPAVCLDAAIEAAAEGRGGFGRVAILKLDCEGGEFPALLTAGRLDLVDYILGEFHEYTPRPGQPAWVGSDWPVYDADALKSRLESAGFNVTLERDSETLGHFWAGRPGVEIHY